MLPASALVASGLHALVCSSVTGTRLVGRKCRRGSRRADIARICCGSSVLVHAQYLSQHCQVIGTCTARRIQPGGRLGRLAGMAAGAGSANTVLPRSSTAMSVGRYSRAARRILQPVRLRGLQEEPGGMRGPGLGCLPVAGVPFRDRDLDRRDRLAADHRPEVPQPFLAGQPDVQVRRDLMRPAHPQMRKASLSRGHVTFDQQPDAAQINGVVVMP